MNLSAMIRGIHRPGDSAASHAAPVSTLMRGVTLPLCCALLFAFL